MVLPEMLYQALFFPPEAKLPGREVVFGPNLNRYFDGFGRKGDCCLVAEVNGMFAGAVSARLLAGKNKGYGYVDDETPELAIALLPEYRGRGIGTQLMEAMLSLLRERGCRVVRDINEDYVMVCDLRL